MAEPHSHRQRWIDLTAIGLSGLCLLHCLATTFLIGLLTASEVFAAWSSPAVHVILLLCAAPMAVWSLGNGQRHHGQRLPLALGLVGLVLMGAALFFSNRSVLEVQLTVVGVCLLGAGHGLNLWLSRRSMLLH